MPVVNSYSFFIDAVLAPVVLLTVGQCTCSFPFIIAFCFLRCCENIYGWLHELKVQYSLYIM